MKWKIRPTNMEPHQGFNDCGYPQFWNSWQRHPLNVVLENEDEHPSDLQGSQLTPDQKMYRASSVKKYKATTHFLQSLTI